MQDESCRSCWEMQDNSYFREIIECPTVPFEVFFSPRSQTFNISQVSVVWTKRKISTLIILFLLSKEHDVTTHKIRVLGFIFNTLKK